MSETIIIKKKKVVHGGAHHGGSWKVAYADFVTAMMAFFLVMWLVGLSQDVRNKIQGYFNDPFAMEKSEPGSKTLATFPGLPKPKPGASQVASDKPSVTESKDMADTMRKVQKAISEDKQFQKLLSGIHIALTADGLSIEFAEIKGAVFFESGSAVIRPDAKALIDRIAPILAESGHSMVVQGHTDAQAYANSQIGNWQLSSDRALALGSELLASGVKESQLEEVSGYGPRRLLDPKHPTDFSNRRVTILLPRKYNQGSDSMSPSDSLRSAIHSQTSPVAVEVAPDPMTLRYSHPLR